MDTQTQVHHGACYIVLLGNNLQGYMGFGYNLSLPFTFMFLEGTRIQNN
jgi:hypothetical protein